MNIEEIKKYYPSLKMWADHLIPSIYKEILKEQLITEFLYTVEPNKTAHQLIKQVGRDAVYINFTKRNDKIINILLTFRDKLEINLKQVNDFMEKFGWYPSVINEKNGGKYSSNVTKFFGFKNITILYEAKYDEEVKITEKYLYHLTPDLKWSKIKYAGLTPKNQMKISDHPGRIYLLKNIDNLENFGGDISDISFSLLDKYPYKDKVKEMYLLQIDTSQLENHKFFEDPNFFMGEAVWTYQNIPPSAIIIKDKINVLY